MEERKLKSEEIDLYENLDKILSLDEVKTLGDYLHFSVNDYIGKHIDELKEDWIINIYAEEIKRSKKENISILFHPPVELRDKGFEDIYLLFKNGICEIAFSGVFPDVDGNPFFLRNIQKVENTKK